MSLHRSARRTDGSTRWRANPTGVLPSALLAICVACTPTRPAVIDEGLARAMADLSSHGWRTKRPPTSEPELGRIMLADSVEVNKCFNGTPGTKSASWSSVEARYSDIGNGELVRDFGPVFTINNNSGSAVGPRRGATVRLSDLTVDGLDALYIDPSGACASDDGQRAKFSAPSGMAVRVVSRELKAGGIQLDASAEVDALLAPQLAPYGGISQRTVATGYNWEGVHLYFADLPACVNVSHQTRRCTLATGPGNTCEVAPCGFTPVHVNLIDGSWQGKLSCEDHPTVDLQGTLGEWRGANTAPGVSHSVRLENGRGLNSVDVELDRWTVKSADAGACNRLPPEMPQERGSGARLHWTLGVGATALIVGATLGSWALVEQHTADTHCNVSAAICDPTGRDAWLAKGPLALASDVVFVGGGVAALATWLLWPKEAPSSTGLALRPQVSGGSAVVEGHFW